MSWKDCVKRRIAKEVKEDQNLVKSAREIAGIKFDSSNALSEEHYYAKISLLYDSLREYLECMALDKGYKIYNHECYTYFLKEILNMSSEGDMFDNLRKIRNKINYYGRKISKEEANEIIKNLKFLIGKFGK